MNVGSTGTITINEHARYVIVETGSDGEPVCEAAKTSDARDTLAGVSKAKRLIGYEPSTSIGVSWFMDCYRADRDWHEPLVLAS